MFEYGLCLPTGPPDRHKLETMKHTFLFFTLLFPLLHVAQEESPRLKIHSASISPNFYAGNGNTGFLGNADVSFSFGKHLLKASALAASEVDVCILGPCYNDNYYSFDLMYGQEFKLGETTAIDLFAGAGYFKFQTRNPNRDERGYVRYNTIGFPLQGRLRFRDGKTFNVGIQIHANINTESSIFAIGPFFQWNFHPTR